MLKKALMGSFGLGVSVLLALPVFAQPIHPFELPQPANAPERLLALVEIPKGSQVKYEIDPVHGGLMVDRFLPDTHRYPAHYGGLPSVMAADGDLMDVLVITPVPLVPGALIEVVPVGLARMRDGGEQDDKVLAIPMDDFNRQAYNVPSLVLIDSDTLTAIEQFFTSYKASEGKSNPIEWQGFGGPVDLAAWWSNAQGHDAKTLRPSEVGH